MSGWTVPKFVYEHTNAEGMSYNRNRAGESDAQRVIFHAVVGSGKDAKRAENPLTWRQVLVLWRDSCDFRDVFVKALNEEWCYGCEDYTWECAPVSTMTLGNKCEMVVKKQRGRIWRFRLRGR